MIERAEAIHRSMSESRAAIDVARPEMERVLKAQFKNADTLIQRVGEMEPAEIRALSARLRENPLALTGNHPRTGRPDIPGVTRSGTAEAIEAELRTVRASGIRGLLGQDDRAATEHQARIAATVLDTWADVRARTDETRRWAAERLGMPADAAFDAVAKTAMQRLAEERERHGAVVQEWGQLHPAPSPHTLQRRLAGLDPELQRSAHTQIPALASALPAPAEPAASSLARPQERAITRPGIDR